jgi:hypothetical protein
MNLNEFFENPIDEKLYRKLNKDKSVNYHFRSDNVGQCAKLFEWFMKDKKFTKKNWQKFYFDKRPKEPLIKASQVIAEKYGVDINVAKEYVLFRIVGQTWNGMVREMRIVKELEQDFNNILFKKCDYEKDEQYFTDYEAFDNRNKLLFGIQIKPISYEKMSTPYQKKAKEQHQKQKDAYMDKYNTQHFMVYYDGDKIHEKERLLDEIDTMLFMQLLYTKRDKK